MVCWMWWQAYRDRIKDFELIPPQEYGDPKSAPIFDNIDRDDEVDLYKFPVPFFHEEDGGRYIGTGDLVIMKDTESDWVNHGTYRVQIHDKNTVGLWMSPGKHGTLIKEKYFAEGKDCPVLISVGHDPLFASFQRQRGRTRHFRVRPCRRPSRPSVRNRAVRTARPADPGAWRDLYRRRNHAERKEA